MLEEIIVILITTLLTLGSILLCRLLKHKWFDKWKWMLPISFPLGHIIMYYTTDQDGVLYMVKDVLLWAFVIFMIYVNVRLLIKGTRDGWGRGKKMFSEAKNAFHDISSSFKKKDQSLQNDVDEEEGEDQ